jgi:hypothetical protein
MGLGSTYEKKYMQQKGIDNVRGGSYCDRLLTTHQTAFLQAEFNSVQGNCFKCNKPGHYASACNVDISDCMKSMSITDTKKKEDNKCSRCNRKGHKAAKCYARKNAQGVLIEESKNTNSFQYVYFKVSDYKAKELGVEPIPAPITLPNDVHIWNSDYIHAAPKSSNPGEGESGSQVKT